MEGTAKKERRVENHVKKGFIIEQRAKTPSEKETRGMRGTPEVLRRGKRGMRTG